MTKFRQEGVHEWQAEEGSTDATQLATILDAQVEATLALAYEVSLHYDKHPKHCPTITTLEALDVTYMVYTAQRDSIEVEWAKQLPYMGSLDPYPIVLISAHGQYVDHWTGFDRFQLNQIPAARAAAIHAQESAAVLVRVPSRELVAA
jgi:hypothetical protein